MRGRQTKFTVKIQKLFLYAITIFCIDKNSRHGKVDVEDMQSEQCNFETRKLLILVDSKNIRLLSIMLIKMITYHRRHAAAYHSTIFK